MSSLETSSGEHPGKSEYEVVTELLTESRCELNVRVLEGQEPDQKLISAVEYYSKRASQLAMAANVEVMQ